MNGDWNNLPEFAFSAIFDQESKSINVRALLWTNGSGTPSVPPNPATVRVNYVLASA